MICSGPDGDCKVAYDADRQRLLIDGEEHRPMAEPSFGGRQSVVMVFAGGPIMAVFEPVQMVQYSSTLGTLVVREDRCRLAQVTDASVPESPDLSIRQIQQMLNALGFDAGPLDGIEGPKTRSAIAALQESLGEPTTGTLTPSQMADLAEQTEG